MARFDVYPLPGRGRRGFVMDVQAGLLDSLDTRAVVPLLPTADAPPPMRELNPIFDIDDAPHVMVTQAIASVPTKELRGAVVSLDRCHDEIRRALDILLVGF